MSNIAKVQSKLAAAKNCHPGAVQTLIAEAIDALDEFSRAQIGRQPPLVLTGYQLRDALEFVAPDDIDEQLEQSVCIAVRDNVKDEDGEKVLPVGLFAWLEEYPDEGLLPLDGEPMVKSRQPQAEAVPVDMVLYCPKCGQQHIDAQDSSTPDWTNPPHKSHLCHGCGHIWRPSDTPTNGVKATASGKDADTAPKRAEAVPPGYAGVMVWLGDRKVVRVTTETQIRHEIEPGFVLRKDALKAIAAIEQQKEATRG